MESNRRGAPFAAVVSGALLAGAFCFWGGGLQPIWWCLWVGVCLAFAVVSRIRSPFVAGLVASLVWLIGSLNLVRYLHVVIGVPIGVWVPVLLLPALVFGVVLGLWHWQIGKGAVWRGALLAPALWTAYEFGSASLSPHGTFGNLVYSQMDFLPVAQVASLAGSYAIGFCIVALGAGFGIAFWRLGERRRSWAPLGATAALVLSVVVWGWIRTLPSDATAPKNSIRVGAIASSDLSYNNPQRGEAGVSWLRQYEEAVDAFLEREVVSLLVLPEKLVSLSEQEAEAAADRFAALANRRATVIVVGWERRFDVGSVNEAVAFLPNGERRTYAKRHLLPGLEGDNIPGVDSEVFELNGSRIGLAICKDMDFLDTAENYGELSVRMVAVPAWDFGADGWLHSRMAMLRGIEGGFGIVRSARNGRLTVSDSRGRVLSDRLEEKEGFVTLRAEFSDTGGSTMFAQLGNWFGWLCVAVGLAALVAAMAGSLARR